MAQTIECLQWASLTATVNEIKSPNSFLKEKLFGNHQTFPTEQIEIGLLTGDRKMAPFVRKDGEAVLVSGLGESFQTVSFPSIRIKRPLTPSELLFNRRPGSVIFPSRGQQLSAIEAHVARDMQRMADMVTNAEEWLCAQALRGEISYTAADESHFKVTYPKPGSHSINASTAWSTHASASPATDIKAAKKLLHDTHGLPLTDVILDEEAASNFVKIVEVQKFLDLRNLEVGSIDLRNQYLRSGALYLGRYLGVDIWEYSRAAILANGSSEGLIRTGYAECVAAVPEAEMALYYGAIPDQEALEGRLFQGERFSKSWLQQDPSARIVLVHSRPLPVMRRPGAVVSINTTP